MTERRKRIKGPLSRREWIIVAVAAVVLVAFAFAFAGGMVELNVRAGDGYQGSLKLKGGT